MSWQVRTLLVVPCLLLLAPGCGRSAPNTERGRGDTLDQLEPFGLAAVLTSAFGASASGSVELAFEACDAAGEGIPFALLELNWEEGGRTAFQTDESGTIRMLFHASALPGDATVWVRILPIGHSFIAVERDDAWRPLTTGLVRISVLPGH